MAFDAELLFHSPYRSNGIAIDYADYGKFDEFKNIIKQTLDMHTVNIYQMEL